MGLVRQRVVDFGLHVAVDFSSVGHGHPVVEDDVIVVHREVEGRRIDLIGWIVQDGHGQTVFVLDSLAIAGGDRLAKINRIDDEIIFDVFSSKKLIDCFRLTGEVFAASSPISVDEKPRGIFGT